jgi:hypothetical protein
MRASVAKSETRNQKPEGNPNREEENLKGALSVFVSSDFFRASGFWV